MRRVLHLITNLGQGGAERQMTYLAGGLVRLGWDVQVGLIRSGLHDDENIFRLDVCGATVHWLRSVGSYDLRTPLRLRRLIHETRPDIVQTWIPMMDVLGGLAARSTRTPWIMSERNTPDFFGNGLKFRGRRWLARGASAVVSNSKPGDRYWASRLPDAVARFVVPNALPLDEIRGAPSELSDAPIRISEGRPIVMFAGRLNDQKNMRVLLPALEEVTRTTDTVALICGIGPLSEWIESYIAVRGITDRIHMVGFTRHLWSLMKRATVFVSVSLFEGMPNTVMEAGAIGCPLVLSDIPHHRELFDEDSAAFANPTDPNDIASTIVSVLGNPAAARARAERAAKAADSWSVDRAAERYAAIYDEILELAA